MPSLRTSLLALAATLAVGSAHAATAKPGKPAASQSPARAWATRDQLRECLDTEAALKERFLVIDASTTAHEKMLDQIEAESARIEELHSQLDHDSRTSVKAFNVLVDDHNLHVKQLNQDAEDSRPAGDAYNADMVAFNHKCAGHMYRIEDMEAVTRERKKAAEQAAAASGAR
jgi:hypothetical protein